MTNTSLKKELSYQYALVPFPILFAPDGASVMHAHVLPHKYAV